MNEPEVTGSEINKLYMRLGREAEAAAGPAVRVAEGGPEGDFGGLRAGRDPSGGARGGGRGGVRGGAARAGGEAAER